MTQNLKNRLNNYGITPPGSSWEVIADELSASKSQQILQDKILAAEVDPPETVWNNLSLLIGSQPETRVVKPALFRSVSLTRVAAVVAGVVLVGSIFLLINKTPGKTSVASSDLAVSNNDSQEPRPKVSPPDKPVLAQTTAPTTRLAAFYDTLRSKKKIFSSSKRDLYKAIIKEEEDFLVPLVSIAARPIRNEDGEIIQDSRLLSRSNDKYVSITSPSGEQTRISTKFVNLLLYLNGDNDSDENGGVFHKPFLESLLWKSRFQSWRNTISQTAFIPTSTNFMDILEMKDLILQEKDVN